MGKAINVKDLAVIKKDILNTSLQEVKHEDIGVEGLPSFEGTSGVLYYSGNLELGKVDLSVIAQNFVWDSNIVEVNGSTVTFKWHRSAENVFAGVRFRDLGLSLGDILLISGSGAPRAVGVAVRDPSVEYDGNKVVMAYIWGTQNPSGSVDVPHQIISDEPLKYVVEDLDYLLTFFSWSGVNEGMGSLTGKLEVDTVSSAGGIECFWVWNEGWLTYRDSGNVGIDTEEIVKREAVASLSDVRSPEVGKEYLVTEDTYISFTDEVLSAASVNGSSVLSKEGEFWKVNSLILSARGSSVELASLGLSAGDTFRIRGKNIENCGRSCILFMSGAEILASNYLDCFYFVGYAGNSRNKYLITEDFVDYVVPENATHITYSAGGTTNEGSFAVGGTFSLDLEKTEKSSVAYFYTGEGFQPIGMQPLEWGGTGADLSLEVSSEVPMVPVVEAGGTGFSLRTGEEFKNKFGIGEGSEGGVPWVTAVYESSTSCVAISEDLGSTAEELLDKFFVVYFDGMSSSVTNTNEVTLTVNGYSASMRGHVYPGSGNLAVVSWGRIYKQPFLCRLHQSSSTCYFVLYGSFVSHYQGAWYRTSASAAPNYGTLPVSAGGTGRTSGTAYSIPYYSSSSVMGVVPNATGALYKIGTGAAPKFGVLPVNAGGTGVASLSSLALSLSNYISGLKLAVYQLATGYGDYSGYANYVGSSTVYGKWLSNNVGSSTMGTIVPSGISLDPGKYLVIFEVDCVAYSDSITFLPVVVYEGGRGGTDITLNLTGGVPLGAFCIPKDSSIGTHRTFILHKTCFLDVESQTLYEILFSNENSLGSYMESDSSITGSITYVKLP